MKDYNRNYGLPNSTPTGIPVAVPMAESVACPNCGCETLMTVTVKCDQALLKGGKGVGTYIGCPACPFASPMTVVASPWAECN